ncbi:hypothetical protein, partial [Pantoea sp. GbtcB22]|uniref:hypothetical protein n=1 Tax=Pantoea sp. GbtcB22 TaxID=2824767 RepID=UPI001C3118A5
LEDCMLQIKEHRMGTRGNTDLVCVGTSMAAGRQRHSHLLLAQLLGIITPGLTTITLNSEV